MGSCLLIIGLILLAQSWTINCDDKNSDVIGIVGAIVDDSSRIGKEARVAMKMAVQDFNKATSQTLILHVIPSTTRNPIKAALAARKLITSKKVQAILGPDSWEETYLSAEFVSQKQIPILSFAYSTPKWAIELWPFLVQASPNHLNEMKAIAAIVQSWRWYQVTVIYEENSPFNHALPQLFSALREVGAEIKSLVEISPFVPDLLSQELERLKEDQCRVFIVHLSAEFAQLFFKKAKEMKMMERDYVWITTDPITSLVHSFNASTISSMQGVLGVKTYVPTKNQHRWQNFYHRFRKQFMSIYPDEFNHTPGSFAVQAYDATRVVAQAIQQSNKSGDKVLGNILSTDCHHCIGQTLKFKDQRLALEHAFEVINIVGGSYRELGFWSDELGFSDAIGKDSKYKSSMESMWQVFWPGGPLKTPQGWTPLPSSKPLRVGVPSGSLFKQIVKVEPISDPLGNTSYSFSGFAIDVFKATIDDELPFHLPYEFFPFNRTYTELVQQIDLKEFDAVIGDVTIVSSRYDYAEFTPPYTETGLVMVVPVRSRTTNQEWLFLKPFTEIMWILILVVNLFNGFVVWLIERNYRNDLNGSARDQIGNMVWLTFSTLFSLHGDRLHSNLSRLTMTVWLFVALVLTQTYTANLASMLTVQQLEPDISALHRGDAVVGYCSGSYLEHYLQDVLGYRQDKIKSFTSEEGYAQALRSREIAGIFLEVPLAKLFLAKYCKSFIIVGPTYKVGGFGFAFPKGSPLLPSVSKALLKVSESGKLLELEKSMLGSETCTDTSDHDQSSRLSVKSFWVLFVISVATSTIALLLYLLKRNRFVFEHGVIWWLMMIVLRRKRNIDVPN